ncbi:unnamed protein product [Arabidopsis thaliana]|uniref:Uncharacterized protein n=1 Tax=Arabidopsis thaliana TaxID=3702 RepID=A0A5S9Y506_ARATH|nr:unnamed protein product [Arabidopsis thaliana]
MSCQRGRPRGHLETKSSSSAHPSEVSRQPARLKQLLVSSPVRSISPAGPSQVANHLARLKQLIISPVSSSSSAHPSEVPRYVGSLLQGSAIKRINSILPRTSRSSSGLKFAFIYNRLVLTPSVLVEEIILCNPSNSPKSRARINRKILLPSLEIPFSYFCDSCINSWRAR